MRPVPGAALVGYPDIDVRQFASRMLGSGGVCSPDILILSDVYDYESDHLGALFLEHGLDYARINTSYLPARVAVTALMAGDLTVECTVTAGHQQFRLDRVKAIVARHFEDPRLRRPVDGDVRAAVCAQEWSACIDTLLSLHASKFLNSQLAVETVTGPLRQLAMAKTAGFPVPATLISSKREAIRAFVGSTPEAFITKSIGLHRVIFDDRFHSYYARSVTSADCVGEDDLGVPMLVQRRISCATDIRVTFVRSRLFVTEIWRPEGDAVDYKSIGIDRLTYTEADVPPPFLARCRAFIEATGLFYGAIDFVRTPAGELVFMEVNTCPDWSWLQSAHEESIAGVFVRQLRAEMTLGAVL